MLWKLVAFTTIIFIGAVIIFILVSILAALITLLIDFIFKKYLLIKKPY